MVRITNDAVKIFILPERTLSAKAALNALRSEPFPGVADIFQPMLVQYSTQGMHMSGHYSIGQHFAALTFKVMQSVNHHLSMRCFTQ